MVVNAAGAGDAIDALDMLPSVLGMAVIGMSVFMDKSLSASERAGIIGSELDVQEPLRCLAKLQ